MPSVDLQLPFEAYRGDRPYIFASYAHKDGLPVFTDIRTLHDVGYRIWYDEGIDPGNEWPDEIAKALAGATLFLVFVSQGAVQSRNVRNEINFALNRQKPFLAVYLEETQLPPGLELRMGDIQAIMKWRMPCDHFYQKLSKALPRELCEPTNRKQILPSCVQAAGETHSEYKIAWSVLLRDAQYSAVRALLPTGREVLCVSSQSPDTWVYAIHRATGKLLWQARRGDQRRNLEMVAWTADYLYLTGEIDVEPNLRFVEKYWLREGDRMVGFNWYEIPGCAQQKYDQVPEWDTITWTPVSRLEGTGTAATTLEATGRVVDKTLRVERTGTDEVRTWEPPRGDTITSVAIAEGRAPVVALSSGHVCLLEETAA